MADLHSNILDARPPGGPNSSNFMQFLGNFCEIVCWRPPPGELAPPSRGNPRSATVELSILLILTIYFSFQEFFERKKFTTTVQRVGHSPPKTSNTHLSMDLMSLRNHT